MNTKNHPITPSSTGTDLCRLTATQLVQAYKDRTLSPVAVMEAVLNRAKELNPKINAFFYIDEEGAMEAARASEKRWQEGKPIGAIDGVPVSIKDSIAVKDMPMNRGATAYKGRPNPEADSPPAARTREAGGIIFAKTTMPDLGLLGAGLSSEYGVTRNPWNLSYNTSGSTSGGSAALAACIGPLTIGSDLGGSVRLPAALCGLSTIKPTQGLIPHLPPSATRSAGPLARTVEDLALFLTILSGSDPYDFGSYPYDGTVFEDNLEGEIKGLKVAILPHIGGGDTVEPVILEALEKAADMFKKAGADVTEIPPILDFPFLEKLRVIFGARGLAEASHFTEEERATLLPFVQQTVAGAENLSAYDFIMASDAIEKAKKAVIAATYPYDVVISPATTIVNFPAEQVGPDPDDFLSFMHFTAMFNQTGQPATVTCAGFDERGLPYGLQFAGKRFDDLLVMQATAFYEKENGLESDWPM